MRFLAPLLNAILDILTMPPPAPCCAGAVHWASFR